MSAAKIRLSGTEMELVTATAPILTMHRVLEKTDQLLLAAAAGMQAIAQKHPSVCTTRLLKAGPKLSRGYQYRQLPYRVLDFPRYFGADGYFAIRSMFWWGHYFSCTLLLSGRFKSAYTAPLVASLPLLRGEGYYTCVAADPWEHHFETDNYRSLSDGSDAVLAASWQQQSFIKLAKKIPLQEWEQVDTWLTESFAGLLTLLDN